MLGLLSQQRPAAAAAGAGSSSGGRRQQQQRQLHHHHQQRHHRQRQPLCGRSGRVSARVAQVDRPETTAAAASAAAETTPSTNGNGNGAASNNNGDGAAPHVFEAVVGQQQQQEPDAVAAAAAAVASGDQPRRWQRHPLRATGAASPVPWANDSQQQQQQQQPWQQQPGAAERPFIPQVDFAALADTLLGDDPEKALRSDTLLGSALVADGGPPRLFAPVVPRPLDARPLDELPVMFYLPGIDGTGLAAYRQFPRLARAFDLRCLIVPRTDRSSFAELVDAVSDVVRAELDAVSGGRPVYLMGESFGGILALALALKLGDYVDRLVLVNPASSFPTTPWPALGPLIAQLPQQAFKLVPFALAPLLSNPIEMARHDVDRRAPLARQASDLLYGLVDLAPQLAALRLVLPPATLAHRLELLRQGSAWVEQHGGKVQQRALVVAGDADLLIPSAREAERLAKLLPRARAKVLPGRSHALLQEEGVDLFNVMDAEGFCVAARDMSNGRPSTRPADGGATAFGKARPIQLPTPRELELDSQGFVSTIKRLTSPVFYSTRVDKEEGGAAEEGGRQRVVRGLSGVPTHVNAGRPVLLVGNHQLFAADMYPMIEEFVAELGVLPRGLAHPIVFAGPDALAEAGRRSGMAGNAAAAPGGGAAAGANGQQADPRAFGSLLSTYGAVPVSGPNMHKLLAQGETVLLYPGGAREAFKRRGEAYRLMWPSRAEFVRMAMKFDAVIVPFAAIGCDEAITTHLTQEEIDRVRALLPPLPRLPWQQAEKEESEAERLARIPAARVGVNATMEDVEAFGSPGFFTFNAPKRTYFIFRAPIETSAADAGDRAAADALYARVKGEVEDGLGYLLRMRESDPYKDLAPRLAYEASWGGGRQAPSFEP